MGILLLEVRLKDGNSICGGKEVKITFSRVKKRTYLRVF